MRTRCMVWVLFTLIGVLLSPSRVLARSDKQVVVTAAEGLATAVAEANPEDTIQVTGGTFYGSLLIDKPLTLIGLEWPVLDGQKKGTVVHITAPDTTLQGFVIRNSGDSLDQENSGITVEAANSLLQNNRFENTLFGIYLQGGHHSTIRHNIITSKALAVPRRGDPIRVWYSNDVLIENNVVNNGRDVVLWYSERLILRNNEVSDGRYGLHFMYCDDALIEHNSLFNNSVGSFLMYSRRVTLRGNMIANNRGPSGYGIGLKDMDDTRILDNLLLDNRIAVHLDTSPREVDSIGQFEGNVFAYNDIGVEMMPSVRHNEFFANSFVENEEQVTIAGGGQLRENKWTAAGQGNYWSDYAGYDAAADGIGDIPYQSARLFEELMAQNPELRLYLHSPAVNAIDFAAKAFPLVRPQPKLEDDHPLMVPIVPTGVPALPQPARAGGIWSGLILLLLAAGIVLLPQMRVVRLRG